MKTSIDILFNRVFNYELKNRQIRVHFTPIENKSLEITKYEKDDFFCYATTEFDLTLIDADFSNNKTVRESSINYIAINEIESDLDYSIQNIVFNIRWVLGLSEITKLIKFGGFLTWSNDNIKWNNLPINGSLNVSTSFPITKQISEKDIDFLNDLIKSNISAPLGHSLFAEAWSLRKSNPRSSLVIGIASLETRFKECVSFLIPEADWLVQNAPSPPLVEMLTKFLLELPVKLKINDLILVPPKKLITKLQNGIKIRNKLVHGSRNEFTEEELEVILRACRDIIYLLDIYCGYSWANKKISLETIKLLKENNRSK